MGSTLTLSADDGWLRDPARVFPVVIDPSYVTGVADCGIASTVTTAQCSNPTMDVGSANSGADVSRALINFAGMPYEVSSFATVMRAQLQVTVDDAGNTTPMAVDVHPVTDWWNEDATWANNTGWSSWSAAGGDYDSSVAASVTDAVAVGAVFFDVTPTVTEWVKRDRAPLGFLVKAATENGANTIAIDSADASNYEDQPQLIVDWSAPAGHSAAMSEIYGIDIDAHTRLSVIAPGMVHVASSDYTAAGTGLDVAVGSSFNSGRQFDAYTLGYGWQSTGTVGPVLQDWGGGRAVLFTGDSGNWVFNDPDGDGTYTSPPGMNATLVKTSSTPDTWTLTYTGSGVVWTLVKNADSAVVTQITDPSANTITVNYQSSGAMHDGTAALASITDTQNRDLDLPNTTCCTGYLAGLSDWNTPPDTVSYTYSGDLLTSVTDRQAAATQYSYDWANNLTRVIAPDGTNIKLSYWGDYGGWVSSITVVDDLVNDTGPTWTFDAGEWTTADGVDVLPVTVTDPNNVTTTFLTDTRRVVHDPLGTVQVEVIAPTVDQELSGSAASLGALVTGGGVDSVEFWVDGQLVGSAAGDPYTAAWDTTTVTDGAHSVVAKAVVDSAVVAESDSVGFTVNNSTTVTLVSPNSGASALGAMVLNAAASSAVDAVEFVVDGNVVATVAAGPYEVAWDSTTVADGYHRVEARAVVDATVIATSKSAYINVWNCY